MKKRAFFLLLLLLIPLTSILSQEIALKTNVLSWATTTINLGAEFKISPRLTAGADIMYKGWSFLSDNRKMGGFLVQPEAKYFASLSISTLWAFMPTMDNITVDSVNIVIRETCTVSVYLMVTNGYGKDDGTLKYLRE